jgi:hypothetical protein
MMYVSISSFFISEIQLWGAYSPIHLLSVWTVLTLCTGSLFCARWKHQSASTQHAAALWPRADSDGVVYLATEPSVGAYIVDVRGISR